MDMYLDLATKPMMCFWFFSYSRWLPWGQNVKLSPKLVPKNKFLPLPIVPIHQIWTKLARPTWPESLHYTWPN
jgi:hypothetical protein